MRRFIFVAALSCAIILGPACRRTSSSGSILLSQDTMRTILWEMFQADSYNELRAGKEPGYRQDTAYAALYSQIFRAHHISRKNFEDSWDYYVSQPNDMKNIIDSLVALRVAKDMRGTHGPPPNIHPGLPGLNVHPVLPNGQQVPFNGHTVPNAKPGFPNGHPTGPNGHPTGPNGHPTGPTVYPTGPNTPPTGPTGHPQLPKPPPSGPLKGKAPADTTKLHVY